MMTRNPIGIRELASHDREAWIDLRLCLWPDDPAVRSEADRFLVDGTIGGIRHAVLIAEVRDGSGAITVVGFAECSLHLSSAAPYGENRAHLEGWFVRPEWRRQGIGRHLIAAVAAWAYRHGCVKLTSDTTAPYAALSVPAHRGCGFRVAEPDDASAEPVQFWQALSPEALQDRG